MTTPSTTGAAASERDDKAFRAWIRALKENVIQAEYGYEEGEFNVFPELWHPIYKEGLTPQQAFRRALDAREEDRREQEKAQHANWLRIQAENAAINFKSEA